MCCKFSKKNIYIYIIVLHLYITKLSIKKYNFELCGYFCIVSFCDSNSKCVLFFRIEFFSYFFKNNVCILLFYCVSKYCPLNTRIQDIVHKNIHCSLIAIMCFSKPWRNGRENPCVSY